MRIPYQTNLSELWLKSELAAMASWASEQVLKLRRPISTLLAAATAVATAAVNTLPKKALKICDTNKKDSILRDTY